VQRFVCYTEQSEQNIPLPPNETHRRYLETWFMRVPNSCRFVAELIDEIHQAIFCLALTKWRIVTGVRHPPVRAVLSFSSLNVFDDGAVTLGSVIWTLSTVLMFFNHNVSRIEASSTDRNQQSRFNLMTREEPYLEMLWLKHEDDE
jgi:hypothetical protein